MCEYCEKLTPSECDPEEKDVKMLYDGGNLCEYVCILEPSFISKRKHAEDGLTATLQVYTPLTEINIPIAYCPICGRKL